MPMVTIPLEEYVDLIRSQHTVEILTAARNNYSLAMQNGVGIFDAIIGRQESFYAQTDKSTCDKSKDKEESI